MIGKYLETEERIQQTMKIALQSKRAILSKSDDYTFDTSQAKTIMEIASVMFLFLKVFYGKY